MRSRALRRLGLSLALCAAAACQRKPAAGADVDHRLVEVAASQRVVTGAVGVAPHERRATYVLVDATNRFAGDLMVTLGGELLDASGKPVGTLRMQSLRVPGAGGVRMFALIDEENGERATAVSARVAVRGASPVDYPPPMIVSDGAVSIDQDRAVVRGTVENQAERTGQAIIIAGFYDAKGRPMDRPSTKFEIVGHGRRAVQFVGPPGSRTAYLYVGELRY